MWFYPRTADTAHDGTTPAAAMITPFSFPCGPNFLNDNLQKDEHMRKKCAPPGFEQYWWSSVGYYSPAICPKGYTAGCMRWNSEQGPPLEPAETAVQCVPSGYSCSTKHISMAYSASQTKPMIQVRWAESDLRKFATHPLHPGVKPTEHVTKRADLVPGRKDKGLRARDDISGFGSFPPTPTPTPTSTSGPNFGGGSDGNDSGGGGGGGLSLGAKVGIGVGVPLGVMVILAIGGFFIFRAYRKKRLANQTQQPLQPPYQQQYAPPGPQGPQYPPQGMYGNNMAPQMGQYHQDGRAEMEGYGIGQSPPPGTYAQGSMQGEQVQTPPPVVVAPAKDDTSEVAYPAKSPGPAGSELDAQTYRTGISAGTASELHAASPSPALELASDPRHEIDSSPVSKTTSPVPRKALAASPEQHVSPLSPSGTDTGPETQVALMPGGTDATAQPPASEGTSAFSPPQAEGEPSAQELSALMEQHSQLEARKKRLLELDQIEREQEALQNRMSSMKGNQGGGS